jgi:type IV pilus assembly protein PilY1
MRRLAVHAAVLAAVALVGLAITAPAWAKDTDIYRPTVKPNVMVMFDNSGSMDWGVYENTEDYGQFYDSLSERTCSGGGEIRDAVAGGTGTGNYYYEPNGHRTWGRYEVVLLAGNVGYTAGPDGRGYTGDAGDDDRAWYTSNLRTTGWASRNDITLDAEGYVLYNGQRLPNNRSIKLHDWRHNADGSQVDCGLAGLLQAPGYYFSGYFMTAVGGITSDPAQAAVVGGREMVFMFTTGNWVNMRCLYNLQVVAGCPDGGEDAWRVRSDQSSVFWQTVYYALTSPSYPGNYPNNYSNVWTITQPGAVSIKIRFADFYTYNSSDKVRLYTGTNQLIATYSGNKGSFWSDEVPGNKVKIEFVTNASGQRKGWSIDRYNYTQDTGAGYRVKRRIDVARDALIDVIDATLGRINWGLAAFNYDGGSSGNGAKIVSPLNPNFNDDDNRQNMLTHLEALEPGSGTPLCEASEDLYNYFYGHTNILRDCTRNYAIYMSDGYPSADDDNSRLTTGVTLSDNPADGWTQDPSQYTNPNPDLMDDAVRYGYLHSVRNGNVVGEPASSYENITSHCIGFSLDGSLLQDAAADGGGTYYVAYNEAQLVSAFYSLGLIIISNAGYTAPVVSVDSANRTQSGDEVYMAFFKPKTVGLGYWGGNLKRYGLDLRLKSSCIPARTQTEWVIVDHPGGVGAADSTDCDGVFKESSISWWDNDGLPDGDDVERGGVGQIILDQLSLSSPYNRPIYTYVNGFEAFTPTNSDITNGLLGVSSDEARWRVINFVHGFTYANQTGAYNPLAKRDWPLGDIVHAEPAIIDYCPADAPHGCTVLQERLLVVGANDGMLHVFDADSGEERWAFIPPNLLPKLQYFDPAGGINQQDLVDGPMTVVEYLSGDTWRKVLIIGERRGGRAYYALDVTNPDPSLWTMLVNATGSPGLVGGSTPGFEELGQTWSRAIYAKLRVDQAGTTRHVIVFGGGYDSEEDSDNPGPRSMGRAVYVVDLESGELLYSFTHDNNANLLCVPGDVSIVNDASDHLAYFYFVDTGGNVWRTTYTTGAASPWETHRVFASNPGSTAGSGWSGGSLDNQDKGRKMFYPPDVSLGNAYTDYPVLYLGTGDREHPLEQVVHNRIYCIVDSIPAGTSYDGSGPLDERNLVNVTGDELEASSSVSEAERQRIRTLLQNSHGWYIKLDEIATGIHDGEKVLAQATLFYCVAYFTTFTPVNVEDTCNPLGEAKVYALEYSMGKAAQDYDRDSTLEASDRCTVIGESIPSRVKIIIRSGTAAGLISVGGKVTGAGIDGSTRLPQPGSAIETILWRELGPADIARGLPYGVFE